MNYTKKITINADIKTVFKKLTDPDFMTEWQESLDSYEKNEDGNYVYIDSHAGKPMSITEHVLEKKSPTIYRVKYTTNGVINIMNNTLEEKDAKTTKWISKNEFRFTTIFMRIIGFFFRSSFKKQTEKDMTAFKHAVEQL